MISDLKEPFQFISLLLSLGQYNLEVRSGKAYKKPIYNPILFDASCNGIQHLASMTRDIELARKTNVIGPEDGNSESTPPEDLYAYAASLVEKELPKEGVYTKIHITRKLVKKSVMTIPYNITLIGVQKQIKEHTNYMYILNKHVYRLPSEFSKEGKNIDLTLSEVNKIGTIVYNALNSGIPSLKLLKEYLDGMVKIILKLDL
jgi:DNA-directed RNA polymerase